MWVPRKQTDQADQPDLLTFWDSGRLSKIAQALGYKSGLNLVSLSTLTLNTFLLKKKQTNKTEQEQIMSLSKALQYKRKMMSKDIRRITILHCPHGVQYLEARRMHITRKSTQIIPSITGAHSACYCTACLQLYVDAMQKFSDHGYCCVMNHIPRWEDVYPSENTQLTAIFLFITICFQIFKTTFYLKPFCIRDIFYCMIWIAFFSPQQKKAIQICRAVVL